MSEKLEINEICGYLPYGLKIYSENHWALAIPYPIMNTNGGTYYEAIGNVIIYQLKPLLIPLSELTDEQWNEIFKAGNTVNDLGLLVVCKIHERIHIKTKDDATVFSFNPKLNSFYTLYPFNQLAAFNKIYSLHGDIHGLLDRELAINKMEYEK